MKHLPKHLRPRWRYLAVELESWPDAALTERAFQGALWAAGRSLLGDPGSADADLRVLSFAFDDGVGEALVRARRGEVDAARAALACVAAVAGDPVRIRVRGVAGTVRACEEKYMGGPGKKPVEKRVVFRNADRRAVARDGLLAITTDDGMTGAAELDLE